MKLGSNSFYKFRKESDRISREVLWRVLEVNGAPLVYLKIIWVFFFEVRTSVKSVCREREKLTMKFGIHQELAMSLYLFSLVMDELTKSIQNEIPRHMIFSDNVILIVDSIKVLKVKLTVSKTYWRKLIENK